MRLIEYSIFPKVISATATVAVQYSVDDSGVSFTLACLTVFISNYYCFDGRSFLQGTVACLGGISAASILCCWPDEWWNWRECLPVSYRSTEAGWPGRTGAHRLPPPTDETCRAICCSRELNLAAAAAAAAVKRNETVPIARGFNVCLVRQQKSPRLVSVVDL